MPSIRRWRGQMRPWLAAGPGRPPGSWPPGSTTRLAGRLPTVYLAARAASEWKGWSEVLQLLAGEPWIDSLYSGSARVLLARAALGAAPGFSGVESCRSRGSAPPIR